MTAPVTERPPDHSSPDVPIREVDLLRTLYLQHGDAVYRLAYRITGSSADAEDVLQDLFVGLPEALRSYEGRGSLEGWLKRVAARLALSKLRTRRRREEVPLADDRPLPSRDRAESSLDRVAVEWALALLPDKLRLVFLLKEVEGYSHAEIAELLGIRVGASEVRLHRAKKMLQDLLRSDC